MSPSGELAYLDSSALVKLVLEEKETPALTSFLRNWPARVSSVVCSVEVHRAARREAEAATMRAAEVLELVDLIALDRVILDTACTTDPASLRTLDAIHLASALSLGADLGAFVTYDQRLLEAAERAGLDVLAPA
ncbi:MAG: type II toxin-antitoxin system VapC family toxin [Actinomycetota bacterium]|nr:type II toxin-antitoxin system VapC family toxin [Actinomycetota bacterium]